MNIGFDITRGYLKYTYVLVKSILDNNTEEEICFYIFSANITVEDLEPLCELVESHNGRLELISIDKELIAEVFTMPHPGYPIEAHTPYFHIHTLPDEVERILIMDGDMIVKKSLKEVYEMDFGDNYVICTDGSCINEDINHWLDTFRRLGLTTFSTCFTLYNVKKIKEDFTFSDIMKANQKVLEIFGYSNEEIGFSFLFNGKEGYIPETKYGFYIYPDNEKKYSSEQLETFEKDAVAIHYWRCHPWAPQIGMISLHSYWWDYAKDTPYYDDLKEEFWAFWKNFRSKYLIPAT